MTRSLAVLMFTAAMLTGIGGGSGLEPVAAEASPPPAQPTNPRWTDSNGVIVEATSPDTSLRATWSAPSPAPTDYRVQLAERPEFDAVLADAIATGITRTFGAADGVAYGHVYYFRVLARAADGTESTWSPPSNGVEVTDQTTGPVVAHAPVVTGFVGEPIPVSATASCDGDPAECSATLLWRPTPVAGGGDGGGAAVSAGGASVSADASGVFAGGWTPVEMVRGAEAVIDAGRSAFEWSATVPGDGVSSAGIDYFLEVEDTFARTHVPGGTFVGHPAATGVQPTALLYQHVHVVSPPLLTHVPVLFARDGEPILIDLRAACYTQECVATLYYRTTTDSAVDQPLLAAPPWPTVTMNETGSGGVPGGGREITYSAEIPADAVDTRGVDYVMHVSDGTTQAWWPGTTYEGYYAPQDGVRTGYHHVHVLEPPHMVHVAPATAPYAEPIAIEATATCGGASCSGTLYYRTTTSSALDTRAAFASTAMTLTSLGTEDATGVPLWRATGGIPAEAADTRGVDYFLSITDGPTTSWWPGTSHVDGYVPVEGTRVGYHHIRVTDPPHFAHVPTVATPALQDMVVETDLTCVRSGCEVTLAYAITPLDAESAFTAIPMARINAATATPLGELATYRAVIPGRDVTTAGLAYWMRATDGFVTTYQPGTSYWGAYVPVDGSRTAAHAVRVLEPPHVVHAPVATAYHDRLTTIEARSNCATAQCVATLHWRTTGHDWQQAQMTSVAAVPGTPIGDEITYRGDIPASFTTTEGVDYWIDVDDGYATDRTPTWHITVLAPTTVLHAPVVAAFPGNDVPIDAVVPCSTATCTATLAYRIPGETLLGEPAWTTLDMGLVAVGIEVGDATTLYQRRAVIPSADVTVRGLEYFIRAHDGFTTAYSPGTAYVGTQYARVDGQRTHYFSVHVAEPVRIAHVPVATAPRDDPIDITARVNCPTRDCRATLWYRRSGTPSLSIGVDGLTPTVDLGLPPFEAFLMGGTEVADLGDAGTVIEYGRRIPAADVTPDGIDYYLHVTDGDSNAYHPGTSYVSGAGSQDGIQAVWHHVAVTGQRVTATIGDRVWFDYDDDGVRDPVDPLEHGAGGVRLDLLHPGVDGAWGTVDDQTLATQTTDGDGYYDFAGLLPGSYQVRLHPPTIPAGAVLRSTNPITVTAALGGDYDNADFALRHTGVIGGVAFVDEDRDDILDSGDTRLDAVTVQLDHPGRDGLDGTDDDIIVTTTTDTAGVYRFGALPAGTYAITVHHSTAPVGLRLAAPEPLVVTIDPGEASTANHLPHRHAGRIAGRAVADDNLDDLWSPSESGVSGAQVELRTPGTDGVAGTADDVAVRTVTTDATGRYVFEELPPGGYHVALADVPPTHSAVSSDPVPATLSPGLVITGVDFRFWHAGTIGGVVFLDENRDGVAETGETRLDGVEVSLASDDLDGQPATADDLAFTATTDATGRYRFDRLPPATHRLTLAAVTTPAGTAPAGSLPLSVGLSGGGTQPDSDLGVWWSGHIEVLAWNDLDNDDTVGGGEPLLPGTDVELTYLGADGQPGGGDDQPIATQATGADGTTRFDYLRLGRFHVDVAGRRDHIWEVTP